MHPPMQADARSTFDLSVWGYPDAVGFVIIELSRGDIGPKLAQLPQFGPF